METAVMPGKSEVFEATATILLKKIMMRGWSLIELLSDNDSLLILLITDVCLWIHMITDDFFIDSNDYR